MSHGHIHWSECITDDVDAAKSHYSKVAGWTFDEMPMEDGTYYVAKVGDQPVGGLMSRAALDDQSVPPHWMTYIEVADINDALKNAGDSGGTVVRPTFDVPGVGQIAIVQEPGGAVAGLIQPAPRD